MHVGDVAIAECAETGTFGRDCWPAQENLLQRLMRTPFDRDLVEQLCAEMPAFSECAQTNDFKNGIDAFFTKKPAKFLGN